MYYLSKSVAKVISSELEIQQTTKEIEFCVLVGCHRKNVQQCTLQWPCHCMSPNVSCCLGDKPPILQFLLQGGFEGIVKVDQKGRGALKLS